MAGSKQKRLVRTYIDPELLRRYKAQFPMSGSLSWILAEGIKGVLAITDGQPDLASVVQASIKKSVLLAKLQSKGNEHPVTVEPI